MQEPSHHRALIIRRALAGLLVLAGLLLTGCEEERPPPRQLDRALSARGRRVVALGDGGEVLLKWRRRGAQLKVYDASMVPVGTVTWRAADGDHPEALEWRKLGDAAAQSVAVNEGGVQLDKNLQLLRRADHIVAVRDAQGRELGVFLREGPDAVRFRPDPSASPGWPERRATTEQGQTTLRHGDDTLARAAGGLSPRELITLAVPSLDPLRRAALALLLERWLSST